MAKQHATHFHLQVSHYAAKAFCAQITPPRGGCWWLISAWAEVFPHTSLCGTCFTLQLGTMPHAEIQVEACSEHRICKACSLNQSKTRAKDGLVWLPLFWLAHVKRCGCCSSEERLGQWYQRWAACDGMSPSGRAVVGTDGRKNWKLLPRPFLETQPQ